MMSKQVAIIGHFGGNKQFLDGQTVKTKVLYDELNKTGKYEIYKIDTYYKKHNPLKLLWQTFKGLCLCDDVFILVSGGGMKVYFPMLYYVGKLKNLRVYHDVIGGNLDKYVEKNASFDKYINSFSVNWVETKNMKLKLEKLGINNAAALPNFKDLKNVAPSDYSDDVFRFCTFSRVMREKGIEEAIDVIKKINSEAGKIVCTLDIYGVVDDGYVDAFEKLKVLFGDEVRYGGLVPYSESVSVLKNYYALLFPTYWDGEGFPGTILDAYASGIPVIASDWNYNRELVNHLKTGLLYPEGDMKSLYDCVKWVVENRKQVNNIRRNCAEEYLQYKPEAVMHIIEEKLNEKG